MFQDVPGEGNDSQPADGTQEEIELEPVDSKKEEKKRKEEEKKRKEEEKKREKEEKKRLEQEKKQAQKQAKSSAKSTPTESPKKAQSSPGVRPSRMVLCRVLLLDQTNFEVEIDVSILKKVMNPFNPSCKIYA